MNCTTENEPRTLHGDVITLSQDLPSRFLEHLNEISMFTKLLMKDKLRDDEPSRDELSFLVRGPMHPSTSFKEEVDWIGVCLQMSLENVAERTEAEIQELSEALEFWERLEPDAQRELLREFLALDACECCGRRVFPAPSG